MKYREMFQEVAFACGYFVDCVFPVRGQASWTVSSAMMQSTLYLILSFCIMTCLFSLFVTILTFKSSVWYTFTFKASVTVSRLLTHDSSKRNSNVAGVIFADLIMVYSSLSEVVLFVVFLFVSVIFIGDLFSYACCRLIRFFGE